MLNCCSNSHLSLQGSSDGVGHLGFQSLRARFLDSVYGIAGCGERCCRPATGELAPSPDRANTPGQLPAAQPISQAATNASGAAQTTPAITPETAKDSPDQSALVKLGPGDLIEVSVYNVPELATKARVSNSGDVYLPLIDYVHVDGLTQEEAQTLIEKRLADGGFVRSPHVTIFVDEAASQGVTIIGEVGKPGIYPDVSDHKLYEVISQAGGFNASASRKIAVIRRNQPEPIRIDLPRNLADDLSGNIDILPGDTITVPRAPLSMWWEMWDVPAACWWTTARSRCCRRWRWPGVRTARRNWAAPESFVRGPTGMTETKVQLKKMLEAKAPDVTSAGRRHSLRSGQRGQVGRSQNGLKLPWPWPRQSRFMPCIRSQLVAAAASSVQRLLDHPLKNVPYIFPPSFRERSVARCVPFPFDPALCRVRDRRIAG